LGTDRERAPAQQSDEQGGETHGTSDAGRRP
jgi:hypothetical protein